MHWADGDKLVSSSLSQLVPGPASPAKRTPMTCLSTVVNYENGARPAGISHNAVQGVNLMALRGQGERTYRARSDASTDLSPYLRGSEEEHPHITHTQSAAHTSTVTKPPLTPALCNLPGERVCDVVAGVTVEPVQQKKVDWALFVERWCLLSATSC